ncbi:MAG: hypothetical protein Tsb0020_25130 [Haliangiales bacterium]
MFNLFDLTGGNYKVLRTVKYPKFGRSQLDFDAEVRAVNEDEWSTVIRIEGRYDGPTDVVGVEGYEVVWTSDGETLFEDGKAKLILSSGKSVETEWQSRITPTGQALPELPEGGELVRVSYSGFEIEDNIMRYEWEGTVEQNRK